MREPAAIVVKEVGPRDGLQNEHVTIATEDKISWINQLSRSGVTHIEITSFVNPQWIPALADAVEVATGIERVPGVTYSALVPNARGLERALAANVDEVAIFLSASETHNRKNINKTIEDTLPVLKEVATQALASGKTLRGYVSTVFGCPYEGKVSIDSVIRVTDALLEMGAGEISLGDTTGIAVPRQVQNVLERLLKRFSTDQLAMHFHDTHGCGLANVFASLEMGMKTFDASTGGLGGCPYAPGAAGNIATDDLLYMLHGIGLETGIDHERLLEAAAFIQGKIGRQLPSRNLLAYLSRNNS